MWLRPHHRKSQDRRHGRDGKSIRKKANILRRVGKLPIKILRKVQSSGYKTHKSLDLFCEKYSDRIRDRYLMYTKDLCKDGALQMVPIYMAPFL